MNGQMNFMDMLNEIINKSEKKELKGVCAPSVILLPQDKRDEVIILPPSYC